MMETKRYPTTSFSPSALYVLIFLLVTAALLVAIAELRLQDFLRNQQDLMSSMTRSTSNEISLLVKKYRNSVSLFAEDNAALLTQLMDDPQNEELFQVLHGKVRRHFPDSFGITMATPDGEVFLDDFEGIVGEICVQDLKKFAVTRHPYEILVHPHAEVYHFDMPVMLAISGIDLAVFFVSFKLDEIARLLNSGAPPEHEFLLVNSGDPELIEVTGRGSRAVLGENIRMDASLRESIGFQRDVRGANWILLDLPSTDLFSRHRMKLYWQSLLIYSLVLAGGIYVLFRLLREEKNRETAERMLVEKNLALTASYQQLEDAQDKLVEVEKMASLGGLVAGIAHEINTPIGIAVTAVSTVREHSESTRRKLGENSLKRSDFDQFLDTIGKAGELTETNLRRASELIRSFKQVAVDQSSESSRMFALCGYIREVLISLQPELKITAHKYQVECRREVNVESYPGAISQIVTNLVLNSLQHGFVDDQPGEIQIVIDRLEDMAVVEYSDNGKGISPQHINQVFEPFFTTARNRGGSGLGLSIVYNLTVQVLGGVVEMPQEQNNGFNITLKFPLDLKTKDRSKKTS